MFQCKKCGECCRKVSRSVFLTELDRGDGICKYLQGNLCGIYDTRPLLCRVDECYDLFFKGRYSREQYYEINYQCCRALQERRD